MLERENFIDVTKEYGKKEVINIRSISRIEEFEFPKSVLHSRIHFKNSIELLPVKETVGEINNKISHTYEVRNSELKILLSSVFNPSPKLSYLHV